MHAIVLKRSVQKLTEDNTERKPHTDRKLALWEKINCRKETKTLSNLVSVDAAADRRGGLRSDSNLNILLSLLFTGIYCSLMVPMIHFAEPL